GGTRMLKADVRVIAATNRDLKGAMTRGAFREDLYYRLHVFAIHLPPLRERPGDILPLLEHFVQELGPVVLGRPAAGISREAREHFLAYGWPGNVRELRNAVERARILCEGVASDSEHLGSELRAGDPRLDLPKRHVATSGRVVAERRESAVVRCTELRERDEFGGFQDAIAYFFGRFDYRIDRVDHADED